MLDRQHQCGSNRLISAVVALALVFAHIIGAYAHAAGHNHAKAYGCAQQDHSGAASTADESGPQSATQHCNEPANHMDSFDFVCNGGLAILLAPFATFIEAKARHSSTVLQIVHLLLAASLERPPKSTLRA